MEPRRWNQLICLAIVAASLAIYLQTAGFEFVRYDDQLYALNAHARHGFNLDSLRWALFSRDDSNWLPLTRLSHILDNTLFGPSSGASHLVNLLLHIGASLMVFWFLLRATGARWPSAFTALLFAVHPLHVESVAWSAERKDVLCALFFFLTLWFWVGYVKTLARGRYLGTLALFCMGLAAKPMMVSLPVVLVLLDFWPLGRGISAKTLREKIPFAALSAVSAVITIVAQKSGGALRSFGQTGALLRIENAFVSWVVYPLKTIWPAHLAVLYPYPSAISVGEAAACALAIAFVTGAAFHLRNRFPYLAVGWFWYMATTLPVIGLIQVGRQAYADRYMYIPMVGLGIALAWGCADLARHRPAARIPIAAAGATALAAFSVCAWVQTGYWRNSEALFRHALAVTGNNYVAYENLGSTLTHAPGRLAEAIACFEAAVQIEPNAPVAHSSLCATLQRAGRHQEALRECRTALRLDPDYWEGHNNMAAVLASLGQNDAAVGEYHAAEKANGTALEPHANLGVLLFSQGKFREALAEYDQALALDPDRAATHYGKGVALLETGDARAAADELETAVRLDPGSAPAHGMLGAALAKLPGGSFEAFDEFAAALRLDPNLAAAHANLALALAGAGRNQEAVSHMRAAVQLEPRPRWVAALKEMEADAPVR